MTFIKLTLRSIAFYRQTHVLTLAGTILTSTILAGALLVGDSIRFTLKQSALLRLGEIHWALETRGRYIQDDLATRLQTASGTPVSPALTIQGIALRPDKSDTAFHQINNTQILGIDQSFWTLTGSARAPGSAAPVHLEHGEAAVNEKLAQALHLQPGAQIAIRFNKPALMARDAPLSSQDRHDTIRASLTIKTIIRDHQLGRFNLSANQQVPHTIFVNLNWLQQTADIPQKANLLLAGMTPTSSNDLNQILRTVLNLHDLGLTLKSPEAGHEPLTQLECDRIFIDPPVESAAATVPGSFGALTYLVNSIANTNTRPVKETPYSFVIAVSPSAQPNLSLVPARMQDDEIIINRWLADQLDVRPSESVRLTYYEFSTWNTFIETNRIFKVSRIIEMNDLTRERELSPPYPSLKDAESCAEWDIGMPLDKAKLTDAANEAYWNQYRTTPKAIITLNAGQQMWSNRFGRLTAARFPAHQKANIESTILSHLAPSDIGLSFKPVHDIALKAATESMDFGQLFLGLSFFLIIASIILTRMLFGFSLQQRTKETGILLALGFRPGQIRRLWIQECVLLAAAGAAAGTALGSGYTRALIWGLGHAWQSAVASTDIQYAATARTLATGFIASFLIAISSLLLAIRAQSRKSAQTLLTLSPSFQTDSTDSPRRRIRIWLPLSGLSAALALIGYAALAELQDYTGLFFAAGSILLISLLGIIRLILRRLSQTGNSLNLTTLGLRNAGRQESRSMTAASLLACGCFLILAVSSMQFDIDRSAHRRDSGTGGFALFGESTLPIQADLNRPEGQQKYGLTQSPDLLTSNIVSMKVRSGDDASCLNLNRAQTPTLIGVDPSEFTKRGAFQSSPQATDLWDQLESPLPDGTIPGLVGDANTAQWGLKMKTGKDIGDVLTFTDEQGRPFRVKLTGTLPAKLSVFQGTVLISVRHFNLHYPSENGVRMFLIDATPGTAQHIKELLTRKLEKWGLSVISTTDRLKLFYSVEKTYLSMFLVLGGLGILLSTVGLTIVILRNIQDRRSELALLSAAGYATHQIYRILLTEFGFILALGLGAGLIAALSAIWPALQTPGQQLPWAVLTALLSGMILFQALSILIAIRLAFRAPLLTALRNQ